MSSSTAEGRVFLGGMRFDPLNERDVLCAVRSALTQGRGGWVATPNTDILRIVAADTEIHDLVSSATLVVPDGMPVIWAARLAKVPLHERVTGSSLIFTLTEELAPDHRSIYLLGGEPGVPEQAASALKKSYPGIQIAGCYSPPYGFERQVATLQDTIDRVTTARPDVVYVGLGCPKQERLIVQLTELLPQTWFVGCGAAIAMAAGVTPRAPLIFQKLGLEWVYRLAQEPGRLAERYLRHDLPFALRLLATSAIRRNRQMPAAAASGRGAAGTDSD